MRYVWGGGGAIFFIQAEVNISNLGHWPRSGRKERRGVLIWFAHSPQVFPIGGCPRLINMVQYNDLGSALLDIGEDPVSANRFNISSHFGLLVELQVWGGVS